MLIWGYRTKIFTLGMVTFLCGQCGNPAAQALRKAVTKFTLFFIPLFPINVKYSTQCTFCGASYRVSKEQALGLLPPEEGQTPPQNPAPQYPAQHPSQPQHPSQSQYPYPPQQ